MDSDPGKADDHLAIPAFPLRAGEERAGEQPLRQSIVVPSGLHRVRVCLEVGHRHERRALRRRYCAHLVRTVAAVVVRAGGAPADVRAWVPAGIATGHECGDFIGVPWTVFSGERLVCARPESDALGVAMPVGVDASIKARWCTITRGGLAVAVNAQHLAADEGRALRHRAIVRVARGHIKKSVAGAKANPPAVVRTGATKRVIAGARFVRNVGDDVVAIRHCRCTVVDLQAHHTIAAGRGQAGCRININQPVARKVGINRNATHASLSFTEQVVGGCGVTFGILHAKQLGHMAIGMPHRQTIALFGEEHRTVGKKSHIPRTIEL